MRWWWGPWWALKDTEGSLEILGDPFLGDLVATRCSPCGFQDAVKIMAKDLVRTRRYVKKFITMRANVQAVSLKIQTLKSNNSMAQAMKGVTKAMATMNRQVGARGDVCKTVTTISYPGVATGMSLRMWPPQTAPGEIPKAVATTGCPGLPVKMSPRPWLSPAAAGGRPCGHGHHKLLVRMSVRPWQP